MRGKHEHANHGRRGEAACVVLVHRARSEVRELGQWRSTSLSDRHPSTGTLKEGPPRTSLSRPVPTPNGRNGPSLSTLVPVPSAGDAQRIGVAFVGDLDFDGDILAHHGRDRDRRLSGRGAR